MAGKSQKMPPSKPSPESAPAPVDDGPQSVPMAESYIFGILALGIINGLFSPMVAYAVILQALWYPSGFLPASPSFLFMFSSLMVSTFSIMLAGVPAALYERFVSRGKTTNTSLWIWVSALAILSMPAVLRALSLL